MSQMSLPDPARPLVGRHHVGAGDTERQAAERAVPRAGTARARVLEELRRRGVLGATDYELNEVLLPGRRSVSAGTRRAELIRDGWPIRDSGRRRATDTSTPAIVWVLEEKADTMPTREEIAATLARMTDDDRAFLKQLKEHGQPGEARAFFDFFYRFPGTESEGAAQK